ncbi:PD-(D/E)XK nuclease family protein [Kitasatospora sp. NPDC001603]|uniref:PD-(D/E)XK nuclease family protein n=1 Tax=Kitasatospora sp. NPDC001603 TaxID=3154388 RepID=UPI00332C3A25
MNRAELEGRRRQLEDGLAAVFRTATATNHHDPGTLSISGLGGCTRRAAYQLARYQPTDDHSHQEQRASHLGQAVHDWVLPRLAAQLGHDLTLVEHDVVLGVRGLQIPGRLDLFTPAIGGGLLVDLKTHGYDQSDDGDEPSRARLLQLYGYAMALRLMGYLIQGVAVVPMSRIHGGTSGTWIGEFGSRQEAYVDARVRDLLRHAEAPAFAPRDAHRGPGLDIICDSCPFMSRCWPGAEPAQAAEVRTNADVVAHALGYTEAAAQESNWKKEKQYHLAALGRTRLGGYEADGFEVEVKTFPGRRRLDQSGAKELLKENNLPIPYTTDKDSRRALVHRRPLS